MASRGLVRKPEAQARVRATTRSRFGLSRGGLLAQQLVQVQVERPELAAVVAGRDAHHARPAGGANTHLRGLLDAGQVDAVDDDLVDGPDALRQFALDQAA